MPSSPLWVFAYGSLLWNPGFRYCTARRARIYGYEPRFCLLSTHYRGTEEKPGLVLALDQGRCGQGVAFQIPQKDRCIVLRYLRAREMITRAYIEQFVPIQTESGQIIRALTYVMRRNHIQYAGHLNFRRQAQIIAAAAGQNGSNRHYLFQVNRAMRKWRIMLPRFTRLEALVRNRMPVENTANRHGFSAT